ncbi:MAG: glutaredoxin domain-containing protein [Nitrosomonas sp.]|nr:glutaredoxin domain-containing protein [Nitrosomonas sp.]
MILKPESRLTGSFRINKRYFQLLPSPQWLMLLLLLVVTPWVTASEVKQAPSRDHVLEVFVRDGCPHCARAKEFLLKFGSERPWLQIIYYSVDHDQIALNGLTRYSQEAGIWPPGVPTFVMNGKVVAGFDNAENSGPLLINLVEQALVSPQQAEIESKLFGTLSVARLGLPLFTLAIGLLDGFNPCAMWVLLFLLSLLVHQRNRQKMALIAGTFVLVSGGIYYAFMAAWLNIFQMVGITAALYWALGGAALIIGGINVKDFISWQRGFSLSIPDSAKPALYVRMRAVLAADRLWPTLTAVTVLAIMVNFIELLCTAGFPAIYTAILTQHALNPAVYYAYLGLYILGYIADDTLMVAIAVLALSSQKLTESTGRWLKLLSGVVMLALGFIMILYPEWLV